MNKMPRVQRSPPASCAEQTKSDTDIPQSVSNSPYESINTASRGNKRPCPAFSPHSEDKGQNPNHEILEMLEIWKKEQDERFIEFSNDQKSTLAKIAAELAEVKLQNAAIQKSNSEIEKTVSFISNQYDDLIKEINTLKKENQAQNNHILNLEQKIQDLNQLSRTSSVEIRNVPPSINEAVSDLASIVTKVGTVVNLPINESQIRDVYRLPGKPGTVRPIIAEFTTVQMKNQLLSSLRNFNRNTPHDDRLNTKCIGIPGDRRPVYVADYLPASSRKLFYQAREYAKQGQYKFCWISNGNIFIRKEQGAKQILIKSEKTLQELHSVNNI